MNEPRYVWVVHYDDYGDRWLSGVFDSFGKVGRYLFDDSYTVEKVALQ